MEPKEESLTQIKIAHITDIHLPADRGTAVHDVDIYGVLERVMEKISGHRPDLVLVTGDIADDGNIEAFQTLNRALKPFPNTMVLPGNHDLGGHYPKFFDDAPYQVREMNGWTLLGINTSEEIISPETMDACKEVLEKSDRVFMALHHPLVRVGVPAFDREACLKNRDECWNFFKSFSSLKAVVFGHTHFPHRSRHNHILVMGTPAVSFEMVFNSENSGHEVRKRHGFQIFNLSETVIPEVHYLEP